MNTVTYSAECYEPRSSWHQHCTYEDCACRCHLKESLERESFEDPIDLEDLDAD